MQVSTSPACERAFGPGTGWPGEWRQRTSGIGAGDGVDRFAGLYPVFEGGRISGVLSDFPVETFSRPLGGSFARPDFPRAGAGPADWLPA